MAVCWTELMLNVECWTFLWPRSTANGHFFWLFKSPWYLAFSTSDE
jgi:hypothetical protein